MSTVTIGIDAYPALLNFNDSVGCSLRPGIGRGRTSPMLTELGKLAIASTAAAVFIWALSLLAPRCLPEHLGQLIRLAAC
jgi:hypothetical protein